MGGQEGELALSPLVHGCLRLRAPVGTELWDVVPAQAMRMEGGQLAGRDQAACHLREGSRDGPPPSEIVPFRVAVELGVVIAAQPFAQALPDAALSVTGDRAGRAGLTRTRGPANRLEGPRELLVRQQRAFLGLLAQRAVAVRRRHESRAGHSPAHGDGGARFVRVSGEQPGLLLPLRRAPVRIGVLLEPRHPAHTAGCRSSRSRSGQPQWKDGGGTHDCSRRKATCSTAARISASSTLR